MDETQAVTGPRPAPPSVAGSVATGAFLAVASTFLAWAVVPDGPASNPVLPWLFPVVLVLLAVGAWSERRRAPVSQEHRERGGSPRTWAASPTAVRFELAAGWFMVGLSVVVVASAVVLGVVRANPAGAGAAAVFGLLPGVWGLWRIQRLKRPGARLLAVEQHRRERYGTPEFASASDWRIGILGATSTVVGMGLGMLVRYLLLDRGEGVSVGAALATNLVWAVPVVVLAHRTRRARAGHDT